MRLSLLFTALLALAVIGLLAGPHIAGTLVEASQSLRAAGWLGGILFIIAVLLLCLAGIVPCALLAIAGGAIFGTALGFIYSGAGILAGAYLAFQLSRSSLRPFIRTWLSKNSRLAKLDGAVSQDGWRMVALLRISPVMPFSVASYALGFSGVSARDYILGTLASLPPLLGYVAIGALGGWTVNLHGNQTRLIHIALAIFGALATLALCWHGTRLIRRALTVEDSSSMPPISTNGI